MTSKFIRDPLKVVDYDTFVAYKKYGFSKIEPAKFTRGLSLATTKTVSKAKDSDDPRIESKLNALRNILAFYLRVDKKKKEVDKEDLNTYLTENIISVGRNEEELGNEIIKTQLGDMKAYPEEYKEDYPNLFPNMQKDSMGRLYFPGEPLFSEYDPVLDPDFPLESFVDSGFPEISGTNISLINPIPFDSARFNLQALDPRINFQNIQYIYQALYDDPDMPESVSEAFEKFIMPTVNEVYADDNSDVTFINKYLAPVIKEQLVSIQEFITTTIEEEYPTLILESDDPEDFKRIINKIVAFYGTINKMLVLDDGQLVEVESIQNVNQEILSIAEYIKTKVRGFEAQRFSYLKSEAFISFLNEIFDKLMFIVRYSVLEARNRFGINLLSKDDIEEQDVENFTRGINQLKDELMAMLRSVTYSEIKKQKIQGVLNALDQNIGDLGDYYKQESRRQRNALKKQRFEEKQRRQSQAIRGEIDQAQINMFGTKAILDTSVISNIEPQGEQSFIEPQGEQSFIEPSNASFISNQEEQFTSATSFDFEASAAANRSVDMGLGAGPSTLRQSYAPKPMTTLSGNYTTDTPSSSQPQDERRRLSQYISSYVPKASARRPIAEVIGGFDPEEKRKWQDYQDMTAEEIVNKLLQEYELYGDRNAELQDEIVELQLQWSSLTNNPIPLRAKLPDLIESKNKASNLLIFTDTEGRVNSMIKGLGGRYEKFEGYTPEQIVDLLFEDVQKLKEEQYNLTSYKAELAVEIEVIRGRMIFEERQKSEERRKSVSPMPQQAEASSAIFNTAAGFFNNFSVSNMSLPNPLNLISDPQTRARAVTAATQAAQAAQRAIQRRANPRISAVPNRPIFGNNPALPEMRDERPAGSLSDFVYQASFQIEDNQYPLMINGTNIESYEDFENQIAKLGISLYEISNDTNLAKNILRAALGYRNSQGQLVARDDERWPKLIKMARKAKAFPFVYKPKYGDTTTQKLKNVAFLPTQNLGRVVNSDLGTVIIPGQSNYNMRREGLNYVVYSGGKKQTFGSAQDASYFISSGGFGRKSYGPVTERVFGMPIKNLSQAIY